MGKTKQEKKFDRNVEISAPILDPEIIKQIHSVGSNNKKRDIKHAGFKALLSDLNSQDSTDELVPITDSHLPSYIGISCAVSGYSNYSSYTKRHQDKLPAANYSNNRPDSRPGRLPTSGLKSSEQLQANRARTLSPTRTEESHIHHVTIDKSNIDSVDQERQVLTEKLIASAHERRRSPSPMIPPTEDDRHHGAYVGARYFPMPEPSKLVQEHICLLGIDDDLNPDEVVREDVNKVEHKIASLYGDNFVEDWKESMSHKSKREQASGYDHQEQPELAPKNLKDLVSLKPTPQKVPQPAEKLVDLPTPNVKVLASVEKQFLNKLLTDENPPMPKSPSPQPISPVSPRFIAFKPVVGPQSPFHHEEYSPTASSKPPTSLTRKEPEGQTESQNEPKFESPSPEPTLDLQDEAMHSFVAGSEIGPLIQESRQQTTETLMESQRYSPVGFNQDECEPQELHSSSPVTRLSKMPVVGAQTQETISESLIEVGGDSLTNDDQHHPQEELIQEIMQDLEISDEVDHIIEQAGLDEEVAGVVNSESHQMGEDEQQSRGSSPDSTIQAKSPESQISSSTVERAPLNEQRPLGGWVEGAQSIEQLSDIEIEISLDQPIANNTSSPLQTLETEQDKDSSIVTARETLTENLVSFSPEPSADSIRLETNNNVDEPVQLKQQTSVDLMGRNSNLIEEESAHDSAEAHYNQEVERTQDLDVSATGCDPRPEHQEVQAKDGHYFLNLLNQEESFIMEQVRLVEQRLAEHEAGLHEEQLGKMHSAIGKANLLVNKKCNQFRGLCEKSLKNDANEQYPVLNDDLAGFWDMISIQLDDVRQLLANC